MIRITMEFEAPNLNDLMVETANMLGLFGPEECEVTSVGPGDPATATMVRTFESSTEMFEVLGESLGSEE